MQDVEETIKIQSHDKNNDDDDSDLPNGLFDESIFDSLNKEIEDLKQSFDLMESPTGADMNLDRDDDNDDDDIRCTYQSLHKFACTNETKSQKYVRVLWLLANPMIRGYC